MMSEIAHEKLRIHGMTCVNCEHKIEHKLRDTPGIVKVHVSYNSASANIAYNPDVISLADIMDIISQLDYEALPEKEGNRPDIDRMICTLVIIICLYILLQRFGILNLLAPSQLADTGMGYGMLFVIGLITSVHCVAMCGGINLSQCMPRENASSGRRNEVSAIMPAILYNLGRVISYTAVGFLLGLVGLLLGGGTKAGLSVLAQGILKMIAGVFMVIMGVNMLGLFPWLRSLTPRLPKSLRGKIKIQRLKNKGPLVVGLLNGLMPCGPLQSMQIVALASGSPFAGALSLFMFSLGTVPLMLGLGSAVSALGKKFTREVMQVGAVLVLVLGLAMLSQGGSLSGLIAPECLLQLIIIFGVLGVVGSLPFSKGSYRKAALAVTGCIAVFVLAFWGNWGTAAAGGTMQDAGSASTPEFVDGVQVLTSTLSPGSYPDITVQAGTPVKWIIDAPPGSINGCNYKMILQEYGISYAFQEGENVIEFTPTKAGTYRYSCWMGMIHGNIYVTETDGAATDAEEASASSYLAEAFSGVETGAAFCCR